MTRLNKSDLDVLLASDVADERVRGPALAGCNEQMERKSASRLGSRLKLVGKSLLRSIYLCLIASTFCQAAYRLPLRQEEARSELKRLGIEFAPEAFVEGAADKSRPGIVRTFLDAGMDPNVRDKSGLTALMSAADYGNLAALEMLVKHGATIDLPDHEGKAALHHAARAPYGYTCVVALLDHGADPNVANQWGTTPIMESVIVPFIGDLARDLGMTYVQTVRVLLERGANPNATTKQGFTVLIKAAIGGDPAIVKMLLEHGADARVRDSNGKTARENAVLFHHRGIARMIAAAGG